MSTSRKSVSYGGLVSLTKLARTHLLLSRNLDSRIHNVLLLICCDLFVLILGEILLLPELHMLMSIALDTMVYLESGDYNKYILKVLFFALKKI